MLKFTGQKLALLSDYNMLLMFENGIRGGLVQACMRHAKANNVKTPGYDKTKEKSWIIYQDCNNLYGWAMSEYMPYGGFNWVEPSLDGLNEMKAKSGKGRVNLQQAIENGLIVEKVHRVLEFDQSDWLSKYINLNTEMRKKAKNEFEKDFFKLMNNAVFGKTMQSKRKEMKMELVSCETRLQKLINKTTFKHVTSYSENLNAVALENKIITFDKPIYIGFAVLDISKTMMYDYHYNVMKKHYNDNIELMYTDTDSLIYLIKTDDFYKDLLDNSNLLNRVDTSDLSSSHPEYEPGETMEWSELDFEVDGEGRKWSDFDKSFMIEFLKYNTK
ncbi:unnamed protein product [Macrosiphum euphorbiae]|uniref:DNA-directed DNA polymerase n=1 Tax=Macrosiphum euphorbiae TaxID=13131 RepID=A0AAV0X834_9HEMI|nr:unnamed protein product [Macrosiphum euphorbiae]